MRHIATLLVLASVILLPLAPIAQGKEAIQWLKGAKGLAAAPEKAGNEKKLMLLEFFHPD